MKNIKFLFLSLGNDTTPLESSGLNPLEDNTTKENNPLENNPLEDDSTSEEATILEIINPTTIPVSNKSEQDADFYKAKYEEMSETLIKNSGKLTDTLSMIAEVLKSKDDPNKLAEVISSISNPNKPGTIYSMPSVDYSQIDKDDILEKPVTFFSYCMSTNIFNDYVNQRTISPPYGAIIKFTPFTQIKTKGSNDKTTKTTCISTCNLLSKRQVEFVRRHSRFGVDIFENTSNKDDVTPEKAAYLTKASTYVSNLDDFKVRNRLLQEGASIETTDTSSLRRKLINIIAEQERRRDSDYQQKIQESYAIKSVKNLEKLED